MAAVKASRHPLGHWPPHVALRQTLWSLDVCLPQSASFAAPPYLACRSKQCQVKHWPEHKAQCRAASEGAGAQQQEQQGAKAREGGRRG